MGHALPHGARYLVLVLAITLVLVTACTICISATKCTENTQFPSICSVLSVANL